MQLAKTENIPIVSPAWVDACVKDSTQNTSPTRVYIKPNPTNPDTAFSINSSQFVQRSDSVPTPASSSSSQEQEPLQTGSSVNIAAAKESLKLTLDLVLSSFSNISPRLVTLLMNGHATVAHIGLLNLAKDVDIEELLAHATNPFKTPLHMLECLVIYHSILTLRIQYATGGSHVFTRLICRQYNAFVALVMQRLGSGTCFSKASKFVVHHLTLSLQDATFDFSEIDLSLLEADGADEMDVDGELVVGYANSTVEYQEDVPEFGQVFKEFLSKVHTSRGLSTLMVRPDFVELFQTANRQTLIQSVSATVLKLCKESKDMWHDTEFWFLLSGIADCKVDELCETVLFGTSNSTGLLYSLTSTPCESLATVDLNRVNSVLDAFLISEETKQRILNQQESTFEIPFLLTALRNGASPMILYLTEELNILMSRTIPATETECSWALLETARTGSWSMFQQLLSSGDMGRVFDGADDPLVGQFLNWANSLTSKKNWVSLGLSAPKWTIKIMSISLLGASFGNQDVFTPLLESLSAADIKRVSCNVEVDWESGCEERLVLQGLSQFDLALLGGHLEEAKSILEVLLEDANGKDGVYNPL
ncbi:UNVERIFIED_CONTAM: hypothetical protein HDU68_001411, partial [Siphonaria sp. JEL0065]